MKRFALKAAIVLASLAGFAAMAMPAAASAATWGPVGTTKSLDSQNTMFTIGWLTMGWSCTSQHFGVNVRKPASNTADVTSATWSGCSGNGGLANCAVKQTATGLPWTIQAPTTSNVTLNVANVNVTFSGSACASNGQGLQYSGSLSGGVWNASTHTVTYTAGPGLVGAGGFGQVTVSGSNKDPAQLLTLF
jgi:hypothetical protein